MTKAKHSTNDVPATPTSPAAALWRIVVSEYEQAHAQFEANWAAYEAAEAKVANTATFRRYGELADAYGLRSHMTLAEMVEAIDPIIEARERQAVGDRDFTDEEADAQADEAQRIAGEFLGLKVSLDAIRAQERDPASEEHSRFTNEVFYPAREKLFATPAPDIAAVLFKAEVLAVAVDEAEGLRDDLNRLFGGE
jgi:hypothetical protein